MLESGYETKRTVVVGVAREVTRTKMVVGIITVEKMMIIVGVVVLTDLFILRGVGRSVASVLPVLMVVGAHGDDN